MVSKKLFKTFLNILYKKKESLGLFLLFVIIYLYFQLISIYGGDSGDLVTAAWVRGIPHPPGYPLYSLIASFLIHFLPFATPAWRVGLLSSISSAAALAIFYLLLYKFTKNKLASLIATSTLGFIYPFWLYSEVAEVFALNNLFAVFLTFVLFILLNKPTFNKLLFFVFTVGLSLSHHHTIVLLFPAFVFLLSKNKRIKKLKLELKHIILLFLALLLGLSFYIYPLLACKKGPLICWSDPTNFTNLLKLASRANYGTFKSAFNLVNNPMMRFIGMVSFLMMIVDDFSIIGLILIFLGAFSLFKKNKQLFSFILIVIVTCLFFVFYASFPLAIDFSIATFERFLLLPYIFLALLFGFGIDYVLTFSKEKVKTTSLSMLSTKILINGLKVLLITIPLSMFILNSRKIFVLKNNLTAEATVKDFILPLPENSILFLTSDTTIFNSEYVRYVLNIRPDVIVLPYQLIHANFYQKYLVKNFPQLNMPQSADRQEAFEEFLNENSKAFEIFIDDRGKLQATENWQPYGLSWQYYSKDREVEVDNIVARNKIIWKSINDLSKANPRIFLNLFLADNIRVYQNSYLEYGFWLLENEEYDQALEFFIKAENLNPKKGSVFVGKGAVYLYNKDCQKAKDMFLKALEIDEKSSLALGYLRKTALECFNNADEAKFFEDQCVEIQKGEVISPE
ncbi:protein O-mannosyl-transferase family [Patescibacteria group bacterium]